MKTTKYKIKTYIMLLRGVMPGGKNKVPMARLREVLIEAGFGNVRTYIQSGNVLVDTELSIMETERRIRELIKMHIGPDLTVIGRTGPQLSKVLAENPFGKGFDIKRIFFVSFIEPPARQKVEELRSHDFLPEKLVITRDTAYMYIPGTYGRGALSNNFLEKKLGVSATMRNSNTLSKLIAMSKEKGQ